MVDRKSGFGHRQLAEDDRSRAFETLHHSAGVRRDEVPMDAHPGRGRRIIGVAQILDRDRHAVERAAPETAVEFRLCLPRFGHRAIGEQRRIGFQRALMPTDPRQDHFAERRRL